MATTSFVTYLQRPRELPVPEFRAPPPSPVTGVLTGSSSGSSGYGEGQGDDDTGRFLRCSARVPVLRLPERPGPRRNKKKQAAWAPPVIDMRVMCSPSTGAGAGPAVEALTSAAVAFGCFQVIGHEVDEGLVLAALRAATARERSSASKEDGGGDEDSEELWWPPSREGDREMAGNRPLRNGIKQIRNAADDLFSQVEQASSKLLDALRQGNEAADTTEPLAKAAANGSRLCIRKNHAIASSASGPVSQDDVLRMLVRSSRCSRALALALHLCPGASAFHVFSRRGWSRFRPLDGAIVVTVGDQLQAWSGGHYKSVSGKPAYSNDDHQENGGDSAISAEFFLSCSSAGAAKDTLNLDAGKVFPLNLQIMVAICLVLIYHFFLSCLYAR
ncbi:hypothetical protein HU200_037301 [Digitaria exilis]|uniref:Isopenicillin N synthase-like Fe(2+) 2OG dioxygenase domain-containing protein n=1 Tax=Digitaria exilis TaxID=1010633 RepID=A0A835BLA7_9POAL|nr:hypothetical protein HU200_037301 [Digitaria exilis]CAB3478267.1 unnamed protein product [Digitaria exilis]